jgi:hypothetical protein
VVAGFFGLWTAYAFVSGIVAVPYNDIVARIIPSGARSRMLALRFLGGGLLALVVAAVANRLLDTLAFPSSYAAVLSFGALLLFVSTLSFVSAGEPEAPPPPDQLSGFVPFLKVGLDVLRADRRFRLFVYVRWLAGAIAMALPFYVLQATGAGLGAADVATLLGAQTAGALASNPFWGFWGDRRGKRAVLEAATALALAPPALTLAWIVSAAGSAPALAWFATVFLLLGAAGTGETIAQLGYLMEISPDHRRPAYSGYFNALVAPAALSPVLGAALLEAAGPTVLFATSAGAALIALAAVRRLRRADVTLEAPA